MKRVMIPLQGRAFPMCFSLRTLQACDDRFGGLDGLDEALMGGGNPVKALDHSIWLLAQLLDGGYRYDRANGLEAETPPTADALMDLFGLDDLEDLQGNLLEAMTASNARSVEAEAGKNGEATQERREN